MSPVVTIVDSSTGGVKVQWITPNNNGNAIIAYKIEFLQSDGTTWS